MPVNTLPSNSIAGGGSVSSGSSGQLRLAADLDWPSRPAGANPYEEVTGIDASVGLVEVLGLQGKYAISLLVLNNVQTAEDLTVVLEVDGIEIWNNTSQPSSGTRALWGAFSNQFPTSPFICKSSLSLKVQTQTDTSIDFAYSVRPIL